jgi:hypothetical protein
MAENLADEIEAEIARLKRRDEYDGYASAEADAEARRIGWLLARSVELTDEQVDETLASVPEAEPVSEEQIEREVRQALERGERVHHRT